MAARITIGKPPERGGREPTLRDVMRALEELRVEVRQRLDEMAAEVGRISSLDRADTRGDGSGKPGGEVGTEVAESARGVESAESHQAAESDRDEVLQKAVKQGALGAAKKLRRAASAGNPILIDDLLEHVASDEQTAIASVLPSASEPLSPDRLTRSSSRPLL